MDIKDISIPEVYKSSADFRFFIEWLQQDLKKTQYDTENFFDLYDPLRCPQDLVWSLADTMGYKYDSRMPTSFNRLVLLYFMSMIRNRGSKDGVTLAAEVNLAQFKLLRDAVGYEEDGVSYPGKEILCNRLEDTSIPVNTVYVTPHTDKGYIELVYFSTRMPADICIEYVRPLGMFLFQNAGVSFDARTKISIDARLTDLRDGLGLSSNFGPTQVGKYTREDYASMQDGTYKGKNSTPRDRVQALGDDGWDERLTDVANPGERSLYSLELANSSKVVASLLDPIFSIGYGLQANDVAYIQVSTASKPDDWDENYNKNYYIKDSEGSYIKNSESDWNTAVATATSGGNQGIWELNIQVYYPDDYLSDEFKDNRMVEVQYVEGEPRPGDWLSTYNKIYYTTDSDGRFILNKLVDWAEANKQSGGLYRQEYITDKPYNLRYNKSAEEAAKEYAGEVLSYDDSEDQTPPSPTPKVNPIMEDSPDSYQNLDEERTTPTVGSSMSTGD